MAKENYGLVEDVDKFVETQGKEGLDKENSVEVNVDTPPVDNPPVETSPVDNPPVDTPTAEFNVFEHEEYMSLKEKYEELASKEPKELNPQIQAINEWAEKTGRPVEDWIKFQSDPSKLEDMEVVRKTQRLKNPSLSDAELDFLIKDKFISNEDLDDESDVMRKNIAFKQEVADGRELLEKNRLELGNPVDGRLTEEQQKDIQFAQQIRQQSEQESVKSAKDLENLKNAVNTTDRIQLSFGEERVVDFNITPESKKDHVQYIGEMKRWQNEDGSVNSQALAEDAYKLRHFDEIIKLAYTQGANDQVEKTAKETKNLTDPDKIHQAPAGSKFGFVGRSANRRYQV